MTLPLTPGNFAPSIGFLQHRPGDSIKGRYDVLQRLGGGNFGSVYRVRDTAVGNVLACKEMHVLDNPATEFNERDAALDLFRREALNLATIRHPNIPAAYFDQEEGEWHVCPVCGLDFRGQTVCPDHGATLLRVNTRYYLMMDFVDGPTLEEVAAAELRDKGRPVEEARCLEWIHQIGTALRTLHRVGIIHRDIKPDNIKIRSEDDVAILLDFGLTKKVEEAGGYGTAPMTGTARFGTAGYAPENPRERERPEKRSDIHALGMTLFRLLSGRDPQDEAQLREMRNYSARHFNREISPDTERLIAVSIAPELPLRYQSIEDFLRDLDEIRVPASNVVTLPPFTFSDGQKARNATELARLLETHPQESRNYLLNGMFATWLLQYGFAAPAQAGEQAVKVYSNNPDRALEIFRRSLYPTGTTHVLPVLKFEPAALNFGAIDSGSKVDLKLFVRNTGPGLAWGRVYAERKQRPGGTTGLAAAVQNILAGAPEEEDTALPGLKVTEHFQSNAIELDLTLDTSRVAMGSYAAHLVVETDFQTYRIPVSYTVVPLELKADPEILDFGLVQVGRRVEGELAIVPVNPTIGKPRGTVYTGPSLAGIIAPDRFEGSEPFTVILDAGMPSATARSYDGLIQVDTNGGRLRVPVRYRIVLPPNAFMGVILSAIFWGAVAGGALRFVYYLVNPEYTVKWLLDLSKPAGPTMFALNLRGLGPLLAGAASGLYGGWWYGRKQKKLPKHERDGFLSDSDDTVLDTLPMFGLFFGAFGGYLTAQLLHWTVWSLGDWLLYPVARALPGTLGEFAQEYAPVIWTFTGAAAGLVWGVGRILSATGRGSGRYFTLIFAAVAFLALLMNAMLAPTG